MHISALGFRGEALPSIGAVSRLRIVSRPAEADTAWEILVEGGAKSAPQPAAHPPGTRVEVRELFFATPARLKFLKTPRTERDLSLDAVSRLAMAYPAIAFGVSAEDGRPLLRLPQRCRPPQPARRSSGPRFCRELGADRWPSAASFGSPVKPACRP